MTIFKGDNMGQNIISKKFYKLLPIIAFIVIGIVGIIMFYPSTELPATIGIMSILLGVIYGACMGWIGIIGYQIKKTNKIDRFKFIIAVILSAPPYLGILYLIIKVPEKWDVCLLAGSGMLIGSGLILFIWYMSHNWKSIRISDKQSIR
jgi:predicted membrane protein